MSLIYVADLCSSREAAGCRSGLPEVPRALGPLGPLAAHSGGTGLGAGGCLRGRVRTLRQCGCARVKVFTSADNFVAPRIPMRVRMRYITCEKASFRK